MSEYDNMPCACLMCPCMQGHGRSAVTAAAILMAMGGAKTADEALEKTVKVRFVTEFRM